MVGGESDEFCCLQLLVLELTCGKVCVNRTWEIKNSKQLYENGKLVKLLSYMCIFFMSLEVVLITCVYSYHISNRKGLAEVHVCQELQLVFFIISFGENVSWVTCCMCRSCFDLDWNSVYIFMNSKLRGDCWGRSLCQSGIGHCSRLKVLWKFKGSLVQILYFMSLVLVSFHISDEQNG